MMYVAWNTFQQFHSNNRLHRDREMYAKIFQSLLSPLLLMHTEESILICCQCDQVDI